MCPFHCQYNYKPPFHALYLVINNTAASHALYTVNYKPPFHALYLVINNTPRYKVGMANGSGIHKLLHPVLFRQCGVLTHLKIIFTIVLSNRSSRTQEIDTRLPVQRNT